MVIAEDGVSEREAEVIQVRDMDSTEQAEVPTDELAAYFTGRYAPSKQLRDRSQR
ncbi:hypothetical protein GCM10022254_01030 [Actinomadura meridiana]|uniref:Uncharacterized protein n=1 Tax=Actinomadura meridiana TaxID=559626 RepID=A0ABP8BRC4_9ACTN